MISNYMNHHQISFCDEMYEITNHDFKFIATKPVSDFRIKLGYQEMDHEKKYIIASYENNENYELAQRVCREADVLILGNVDKSFRVIKKKGQLVLFYSERLFKNSHKVLSNIARFIKYALKHQEYRRGYLLCASAYAAQDYRITGNFQNRSFKWGYFPEVYKYERKDLINKKNRVIPRIIWVGRLIDWKHPELAIETAIVLKRKNLPFEMEIIGTGKMEDSLKKLIFEEKLSENVRMLGSIPTEQVRLHMEEANIFLFTSDENEGWGAVLNEAMNAACAIVACREAGSVPYLIDNKVGMTFSKTEVHVLFESCEEMILNPNKTLEMGLEAYKKIVEEWNGEIAAKRLYYLIQSLRYGKPCDYVGGPCSPA